MTQQNKDNQYSFYQLIYANSYPHYVFSENKFIFSKEPPGYGWFNYSTDLLSLDVIMPIVKTVSNIKQAGIIDKKGITSFSYIKLNNGFYSVIRQFSVQDEDGRNAPLNKHYIVSDMAKCEHFPYEFCENSLDCWDASKKDNFIDKKALARSPLPIIKKINFKEELHLPKADSDNKPELPNCLAGKTELLKKITAFVFEQLSPEYTGPKRTLLIKDTPENLVLWIKAVSDILPLYWARELTFSTNVCDLDKKAQQRLQGTDGTPFFVIAGIDPKDATCANIPASQMYIVADPAASPDKQFAYTSGLLECEFFKNLNLPNADQINQIEFWKKHPNLSPLEAINAYDAYLKVDKVSSDVIEHPEHLEDYISEYSDFNDAETVQAFYNQLEIIFKDDKVLKYAISRQLLPFVKMVDWINNKNKLRSQNKQLNVFDIKKRLEEYFKKNIKDYNKIWLFINNLKPEYTKVLCERYEQEINELLISDLDKNLQLFTKISSIINDKDYAKKHLLDLLNKQINTRNANAIMFLLDSAQAYKRDLSYKFVQSFSTENETLLRAFIGLPYGEKNQILTNQTVFGYLLNIFEDSRNISNLSYSAQDKNFLNACIKVNDGNVIILITNLEKIKNYDPTWFENKVKELIKYEANLDNLKNLYKDENVTQIVVESVVENIESIIQKNNVPQNLVFFVDQIYAKYGGENKDKYLDTIASKCDVLGDFKTLYDKLDSIDKKTQSAQAERIIKNRLNEKLKLAEGGDEKLKLAYKYIKNLVNTLSDALTVLFEKCDVAPLLKKNIDDILALFKTYYEHNKSLSAGKVKTNFKQILSGYKQADEEKFIPEKTKNEEKYKNFLKKSKEIKEWNFAINPVDEFPNLYSEWTGEKTDFIKANTDTLSLYYSLFPDCKEKILEEIKQFYSNAISWIEKIVDLEKSIKEKKKLYEYNIPVKSEDGSTDKTFIVSIRPGGIGNIIKKYLFSLLVCLFFFGLGFIYAKQIDKSKPAIMVNAESKILQTETPAKQTLESKEESPAEVPAETQAQQPSESAEQIAELSEKNANVNIEETKSSVKNNDTDKSAGPATNAKKPNKRRKINPAPQQQKKSKQTQQKK